MCLSAPVSFVASGLLAGVGVAVVRRVGVGRLLPLALLPCFFALQQFAEGVVWVTLKEPSAVGALARYVFGFFAYLFWPVWVPVAFWAAEGKPGRKQLLAAGVGMGLTLVVFSAFFLPHIEVGGHCFSLHYFLAPDFSKQFASATVGQWMQVGAILFGLAVIAPPFISSLKGMWLIGAGVLVAGVVIYAIDQQMFVSLWCFLAAAISLGMFFVLPGRSRSSRSRRLL